jgi:DNA mismatch repair protein MutS
VVFLHRIADGAADRSYGIHVAQLAGLPAAVIERAQVVLAELESERTVEHLKGATHTSSVETASAAVSRSSDLEQALRQLQVEALTPLQALIWLAEWKARIERE